MNIKPMQRSIYSLKFGEEFYVRCRFVSATRKTVSVLIGNDYGKTRTLTLSAEMGELAYVYEEVGTEVPCSEDGEENMMTAAELAEKIGVSRALVSRWTKEGAPCVFIGSVRESRRGARPRYDMQQVFAWLEGRDARKEVKA